jgi:hypothetical protein
MPRVSTAPSTTDTSTQMALDPYSGQVIPGFSQEQVNQMLSESGKGVISGVGQTATGIGELLPGEAGRKSAEATKKLRQYGYGPSQVLGMALTPSIGGIISKSPVIAGALGGLAAPTGQEDYETRMMEKAPAAALGGAAGLAGEGIAALATSPEARFADILTAPSTRTEVGKKIESSLLDRLKDAVSTRKTNAKKLFDTFFEKAKPFEADVRNGYLQDVNTFVLKNPRRFGPEEENLINQTIKNVQSPSRLAQVKGELPDVQAMDTERRRLLEIARGETEGYGAKQKLLAGDLADLLEKNLHEKVKQGNFKGVLDQYAELSRPVNLFERAFGKKATARAGEYLPDIPKYDRDKLASSAFRSADSVDAFKELAGNNNFVEQLAREHIATELGDKAKAADVTKFLNDPANKDWLTTIPKVQNDLLNLEKTLQRAEGVGGKISTAAKIGAGALGASLFGPDIIRNLSKFGTP